jgi:GrpB-like predicted nucleotidyltransferase (UPF0157 family)
VVRLEPYTPEWKRLFEQEKAAFQKELGSYILDIQHIGSTSIPAMLAKPIVDIAIAVADFDEARVCIPIVERMGYEYRGERGVPRRHMFAKGDPRNFHVHMLEINSLEWQNHLLFRDYLCQHPYLAHEYAELKLTLAMSYPQDREAYTDGKKEFIEKILRLAR